MKVAISPKPDEICFVFFPPVASQHRNVVKVNCFGKNYEFRSEKLIASIHICSGLNSKFAL